MADLKIIYITCSDIHEAKKIAKELLGKKLVACANMFPITSMYNCKDGLKGDSEIILLLKTTAKNTDAAVEVIKKIHSYNIPCILQLDVNSNQEYANWVYKQVK